uniref:Uncharacterized protein n=1 Tax=Bionectria ochroleuca TaxID=29856 RepID=A0A8H7KAD1_BIOOC
MQIRCICIAKCAGVETHALSRPAVVRELSMPWLPSIRMCPEARSTLAEASRALGAATGSASHHHGLQPPLETGVKPGLRSSRATRIHRRSTLIRAAWVPPPLIDGRRGRAWALKKLVSQPPANGTLAASAATTQAL